MNPRIDLVGQRFGRLTVIEKTALKSKNRSIMWQCKCDCGNDKLVPATELRRGHIKSCGCMASDNRAKFKNRFAPPKIDELLPLRESNLRLQYEVRQLRKQVRAYASV